ncbi:MAG: metal ABC transporter permease [Coriobacteriia bacterium]|nr:metal ABC transporter permease [Coriobacteriia bacterium]MCL2750030.1 metal ABC transporter permease [Coriobacteriia bacterium]
MFEALFDIFSYGFLLRGLIVGLMVSICAALLGVTLVLKRFAMIGDGLGHVGFGTLAVATAFGWAPLAVSLPVTLLAAFFLLRLSEGGRIKGDAAIALVSASSLAIGIFVVSATTGMNTEVDSFLFGSILTLTNLDVVMSVSLCLVVLVLFILFYNRIFAMTFDENFAKATGMPTGLYNTVLAALVAITIVVGMRMMGALLISSLIIFPALSVMQLGKSYLTVTIWSAVIAVLSFLLGYSLALIFGTPAGASVVIINLATFILLYLTRRVLHKS